MIHYPIEFEANASASAGIGQSWSSLASDRESICAVPKEFEGPGNGYSPEDFFVLSIQNCFVATFKVFAEYSRLKYDELLVESQLIVDKDETGKPWMKSIHLSISINGVEDEKKLSLIVKKTFDNGFILRSVKTDITHELEINRGD